MLKDLTSENLIRLNIEATDWEDAVRKAAQPLLEAGKVKQSYIDDIIVGAKESGPYFVLAQHVALPQTVKSTLLEFPSHQLFEETVCSEEPRLK